MALYEFTMDVEWIDFTDEHRKIRESLEKILIKFAHGERQNLIAIRGPYGQGKSTLLGHLFKHAWKNGIPTVLTSLENMLPPSKMMANEYSEFVIDKTYDEIQRTLKGTNGFSLMNQDCTEWVKDNILNTGTEMEDDKAVILIDEMEQYYKDLLERVPTNDKSPLKEFTQKRELLVLAAFGPTSLYEAMSSGAEKRRWSIPFRIPLITASHLREKNERYGNFTWWVGKGRPGYCFKVLERDLSSLGDFREFEYFAEQDIGEIDDTPSIELDILARYSSARDFIKEIYPHALSSHTTKNGICKGRIIASNELLETVKNGLKTYGWIEREIERFCFYFGILLNAVSKDSQLLFPDHGDGHDPKRLKALFETALDYAYDIEGGEIDSVLEEISDKLMNLSQNFEKFFYTELYSKLNLKDAENGLILSYDLLPDLFPVPLISPQIEDLNIEKARDKILDSHPSTWWVAAESVSLPKGAIDVKYFITEEKLKGFLESPEIKDYLNPARGILCILLRGDLKNVESSLPSVARWIWDSNRLRFELFSSSVSDFITVFLAFYCIDDLPAKCFSETMKNKKDEVFKVKKPLSRKIARNLKTLEDFIGFAMSNIHLNKEEFTFVGNPRALGEAVAQKRTLLPDFVGLSFCRQENLETVYKFKQLITTSEVLKNLRTGFIWLLEKVSIGQKRGQSVKLMGSLPDVKIRFEPKIQKLKVLAQFIEESDFVKLADDQVSKEILLGIYRNIRMPSLSKEEVVQQMDDLISRIVNIQKERKRLSSNLGINIQEPKSEKSKDKLNNIKKIIGQGDGYATYFILLLAKELLEKFDDSVLSKDENLLTDWTRHENIFVRFNETIKAIEDSEDATFIWLDTNKDEFLEELKSNYETLLMKLTVNQMTIEIYEYENMEWDGFEEGIEKLIERTEELKDFGNRIDNLIKIVGEIDQMVQKLKDYGGK